MTDKLTDSEIVKALEDALYRIKGAEHLIVPKEGVDNLCNGLENALDLINRLQAKAIKEQNKNSKLRNERNRLQAQNKDLAETIHNLTLEKDALFDKAEELKVEVERLQNILICFMDALGKVRKVDDIDEISLIPLMSELNKQYRAELKAEAYKEFAEKAKEFMHNKFKALDEYEFEYITESDIDNLLKEMVGENNATT